MLESVIFKRNIIVNNVRNRYEMFPDRWKATENFVSKI